jgi:FlaA1/EpsC-like NDP-sugar epimerase
MAIACTAAVPLAGAPAASLEIDGDAPRLLDTYALAYAFGIVWLALAMLAIGTLPLFAFDGVYDTLLVLPPVATAVCVLLADRRGPLRSLPLHVVLLATVAGVVSVLSTVVLTPLLVIMFREGVGRDLKVTGLISAVTILVVASPLVFALVSNARRRRFGRATVMLAGLAVAGVALAMAFDPGGPIASLMRLDQSEITMITVLWWLPCYAAAAACARHFGLA